MKKFALHTIKIVLIVYITLIAVMFAFQRSILYFPQEKQSAEDIARYAPHADIIKVTTADKIVLEALALPPRNDTAPIILAFHGNASAALWMMAQLHGLTKDGAGLVAAEYRGYSGNGGAVSEQGLYADADAYYAYIRKTYPKNPVVIYGQSLGSGVAVDLAARSPDAAALILEVPFDSIVNVVGMVYPFVPFPSILVRDQYQSIQKIGQVRVPKLFLIAGQDEVVGEASGLRLYEAADDNKDKYHAAQATHMSVYDDVCEERVLKFLHDKVRGK